MRGRALSRLAVPRLVVLTVSWIATLTGCLEGPERDPSQWPIARLDIEREIPTDDPAELTYRTSCLACHGVDGRGAGGSTGADFTSPDGPLRRPDAELLASIRDGRRGDIGVMPPHAAILDEAAIVAVLAFVRQRFGPELTPEPSPAAEAPEGREGGSPGDADPPSGSPPE